MNTSKSIYDQPLNNSISKQRYTFSKAPRETYSTKQINGSMYHQNHHNYLFKYKYSLYNLPDSLSKRMAGIGYGSKHDFTKYVKQVPAPNKYDIKSFADLNIEDKKGIQFALGREDTWLQGIWATLTQTTPPPDRYQIPSTVTRRQKFTFGQRTQSLQKFNTPGPGNYEYVQAITQKGVYPLSKFQNSGACIIGKDQERFKTFGVNDYPEPGRYTQRNALIKYLNLQSHFEIITKIIIQLYSLENTGTVGLKIATQKNTHSEITILINQAFTQRMG